jgi:DNA polymerase-3 subunit beta
VITVEVSAFKEALKKVGVAVGNGKKSKYGNAFPITNNVLLETKDGEMTIKSTNLESGVIVTVPCVSVMDFSVCVPFKVLNQFASEGNGQAIIELSSSGKSLIINRPTIGKLQVSVVESKDFPPLPQPKEETVWNKLDAKEVSRLFGIVAIGCSKDDSRPVLTAVCCRDGEIASADGFRLYNAKSEKFNFGLGGIDVAGTKTYASKLIPRETVLKFIQLFKNTEEVEVAWGDNLVFFRTKDYTLVSQLVQGTYPKYEMLIPTSFSGKATFSVPPMVQRLKMMGAVKDGSNVVRMIFIQENNVDVCYLQSNHSGDLETPEFDMTMPCKIEAYGKIAVQHNFLMDAVKPFSICSIELNNPSTPMKITGDIEGLTVVIMPLFVQWT